MSADRTEKATPKRREDARRKGQIARRPELAAAAGFLASLVMLRACGEALSEFAANLFTSSVNHLDATRPLTLPEVHRVFLDASVSFLLLSMPVVLAALVGGIVGNLAQGGLTFAPEALMPRADRFNPIANIKRAWSLNSIVELIKAFLKIGALILACYGVVAHAIMTAPTMIGLPPKDLAAAAASLSYALAFRGALALLLLALLDYGYGWYQHEKSLRMTKQEIRDEYRQQEGDPLVKGQRRRAARALIQRQIAAEVPRASVVVTNPTHFAVALRYDRTKDAAPIVVAKGADLMAKRIREIARANDVQIVENPPLARALYRAVDVNRTVPPEFFRAVAELLAYVYRLRARG